MSDRRALVVTYYFPPIAGVGVQRTLKHVTYLPRAGWTPVVVAPQGAVYRVMDQASAARLPSGLEVHRSFCYEPARFRRDVARLARWLGDISSPTRAPTESSGEAGTPHSRLPGPVNRAWAAAVPLLFFPDDQLLWVPFAVASAIAAHREHPARVIYSSSPPVSTHLIAGLVRARTGLPWVVDLRDPWIGNSFAAPLPAVQRHLQRRMERWIVSTADRIVFATAGLRDRYAKRYPSSAKRMKVIPNGYDSAELELIDEPPPHDDALFRLVYTGSLYGERELPLLVEGLAIAVERDPELRARLRVELIGWMTDANQILADAAVARLAPILERSSFVPRDVALAGVRAADAALLLLADGPDRDMFVGGKLFEYIGMNRQVLAIAPPGDARRILEELDWGIVADPQPASVADAIARLMSTPAPARAADPEGRYERSRLAAQLGALFDELAGPAPSDAHS